MGVAAQITALSKTQVFPANEHMGPRFKMLAVIKGNVRPTAQEKRFGISIRGALHMTKSGDYRSLDAKPVIQVSCAIQLVCKIVKPDTEHIKVQVFKSHSDLPGIAICWHQ